MYGSRNQTRQSAGRDTSLDALNRTIEGLEARLQDLMAQGGGDRGPAPRRPGEGGLAARDPLQSIRARQDQLSGRRLSQPLERGDHLLRQQEAHDPAPGQDAYRQLATAVAEMRRELKTEIQETFARELSAIRHEVRDLTTQSRDLGLPEELHRDLGELSRRLDRLGDGGKVDSLRLELDSMRSMLDGLAREESVRALESRWQSVEDHVASFDIDGVRDDLIKLAYRIDDVRDIVTALPVSSASQDLEDRIETLSRAIEELARRSEIPAGQFEEYFSVIGQRLEEITQAVIALQAQQQPMDMSAFERLESRIEAIAKKLNGMENSGLAADVGGRLDTVSARLDRLADEEAVGRLDQRLAELQMMLESGAGAAPGEHAVLPELSRNIAALAGKLDRAGSQDVSEQLAMRLDDLAMRIETLHERSYAGAGMPDAVIGRLEELIGRVEENSRRPVDPMPGIQSLEDRLSDIAARLDQPSRALAGGEMLVSGLDGLEARLADISAKLDRAGSATESDSEALLRSLEDQIAGLSRQIAAGSPADMERLEMRLGGIEEHLSTNDEYIIEAARQAAEAALSAYGASHAGRGGAEAIGNMEIVTALADDLKALEALSRKSEDRNIRALEGVQETLYKIAERLERLQVASPVSAPAPAPAAAMAEAEPPRMPRADADILDTVDESERLVETEQRPVGKLSPAEAAAQAAAYAREDDENGEVRVEEGGKSGRGGKSFLAGLTSRIRSAKSTEPEAAAEPRFTETETPPLEPDLTLDKATANLPLEPGSGAPDINRILQKVRESQANAARNGQGTKSGDSSEFLASARRAAMAAAAEVETLGKSQDKGAGKTSFGDILKFKRRPILMAIGAVLLVVMSVPLISDFLGSRNAPQLAEAPAISEPAESGMAAVTEPAVTEPAAPATDEPAANLQGTDMAGAAAVDQAEAAEPQQKVRVVEMEEAVAANEAMATDMAGEDTAAEAPTAGVDEAVQTTAIDEPADGNGSDEVIAAVETALLTDLDNLPEGLATPELRQAAEDLNPLAFYEIGARFTEGRGTAVDLARAAVWYQRAADLGHAPAQYRLANFYEKGSGLPRDIDAAKKWYQLAAEQGNASAMHNLAVLYATAGAAPDYDSAARWFERAANLGVRDSQVNLAILYARGDGVDRDLEQSYKWFAIAANDGDKDAAEKRDEVFNALRPERAEAARGMVADWQAQPIDQDANSVVIPETWQAAQMRTASVDMSKAIRNIQAILNNNGYDAGAADGIMGARTVAAIKDFQEDQGMEPTGEVTDALVRKLLASNG